MAMDAMTKESILLSLFRESSREPKGVSRRAFVARNHAHITEIDALIAAGAIEVRGSGFLRLPLVGLAELADTSPEAGSVFFLCDRLFDVVRNAFIGNPDEKLSDSSIAELADMPEGKVTVAIGYLLDAPIWEGWSTSQSGVRSQIVVSDRILRYRNLEQVVDELRSSRRPDRADKANRSDSVVPVGARPHGHPYVALERLEQLKAISGKKLDLRRLVRMCEELNSAFDSKSYISCSMLVRGIVDHIPPIFGHSSFGEVASNYGGGQSFQRSMKHLDQSLRNLADGNLHTHVRRRESLPSLAQVTFWADLDRLLEEVVRIMSDES